MLCHNQNWSYSQFLDLSVRDISWVHCISAKKRKTCLRPHLAHGTCSVGVSCCLTLLLSFPAVLEGWFSRASSELGDNAPTPVPTLCASGKSNNSLGKWSQPKVLLQEIKFRSVNLVKFKFLLNIYCHFQARNVSPDQIVLARKSCILKASKKWKTNFQYMTQFTVRLSGMCVVF